MANPQKENGHTSLANEIWDHLCRYRLSGEEWQCLIVIFRKTYGWQKKEDFIPLSQFVLMTGMKKPNIVRSLKKLLSKQIIAIIKNDNGFTTKYRFNKDFDSWILLSKQITVIKSDNASLSKKIIQPLSKKIHSKETKTKERVKERYTPSEAASSLVIIFLGTMSSEFAEKFNAREAWGKCFDRLLKEFDAERLRGLIVHYRNDDFWVRNFMSPLKLLNKNKDGIRYVDYFFERMKPRNGGVPATLLHSGPPDLSKYDDWDELNPPHLRMKKEEPK